MEIARLVQLLDQPEQAPVLLHGWGVTDPAAARHALLDLAETGVTLDLLAVLCRGLAEHLPRLRTPDLALAGLRSYFAVARSPLALAALLERDAAALVCLLRLLDLSPQARALLCADPEAFDSLYPGDGQPVARPELAAQVAAEASGLADERSLSSALRRFQRRGALRIAYGEAYHQHRVELACEQLALLADVIVGAALTAAQQRLAASRLKTGGALSKLKRPPAVGVLALGRWGAGELDHLSPLELAFVYEPPLGDDTQRRGAAEYGERLVRLVARLLGGEGEPAYRLQFGLRIGRDDGVVIRPALELGHELASSGRTWHRQELLSARAAAGDLVLAAETLRQLQPWLFRRYLSPEDELGVRALKRRIADRKRPRAPAEAGAQLECAAGGLEDIEQTVGLLQLLAGGESPRVRVGGVFAAIGALEQANVLSVAERSVLETAWLTQRRLLHAWQARGAAPDPAALQPVQELAYATLGQLWSAAFGAEPISPPIVELLLHPHPDPEDARAVLGPLGFSDPPAALEQLDSLATETAPYLSTLRCRYHLVAILPELLSAIARSPAPDETLSNLVRVSDSLGGKGVLWELLRERPQALELYVKLCGCSFYLSGLLTSEPGLIDELADSLQRRRFPSRRALRAALAELLAGAAEPGALLAGFKSSRHLQLGVRELSLKKPIERVHACLSDVAETCLEALYEREWRRLADKHGPPMLNAGPRAGEPCRAALLAFGRLGGREPNYHSDLELLLIYEGEGQTRGQPGRRNLTANSHFFAQLAQRVIKECNQSTPAGKLYAVAVALRSAGPAARNWADLQAPFQSGTAALTDWLALGKARAICGSADFLPEVEQDLRALFRARPWRPEDAVAIAAHRRALESGATAFNLKRAPGGAHDVEFLVQRLQLEHAAAQPGILEPNTQGALAALGAAAILPAAEAEALSREYAYIRSVESALRLLNASARHSLSDDPLELARLAAMLGRPSGPALCEEVRMRMAAVRSLVAQRLPGLTESGGAAV